MEDFIILEKFDKLVKAGVAIYDSEQRIIEHADSDLKFQFILTSALDRKPTFQNSFNQGVPKQGLGQLRPGSDINTSGFELGSVGSSHILAMNKFCYFRPHLILISSDGHRRQYEPLDKADLTAAWKTITTVESDYIAIYNCGKDAGCSRLHKHMQVMPMPRQHFANFLDGETGQEPKVSFQWYYHRFGPFKDVTISELVETYSQLRSKALETYKASIRMAHRVSPDVSCPHNVILSRRWMMVIPRRRGDVDSNIAANALGMLGVIAVAKEQAIEKWIQLGPVESLAILGVPRT